MKRVVTILLVVVLTVSVLSASAVFQVRAALALIGDANGDGQVNNRDLGALQQFLSDWEVTVGEGADVNTDLKVNNLDLGLLQQNLTGIKETKATTPLSKYTSLGAPAADYYSEIRLIARCAWDMTIHNQRLYIGCGDYDKNAGESPVFSAPLSDPDNWTVDAVLPDEQVGRFYDYNGVLAIPGYDPLKQPEHGNFYELVDGQWQIRDVLPHGLHNFDIAWFQGQLFASIGAPDDHSPIVATDDGVHYRDLPLYKSGAPVVVDSGSVVRSMNLYVLGDALYADYWCYGGASGQSATFEMYRYNAEKDIMEFVVDMKTQTHGGNYSAAGLPLWEKEALGDKMFITTGYLYYSTDMEEYTEVVLPNNAVAYDMVAHDGRMYILAAYPKDSKYKILVYSVTADNPTKLQTEVSFTYKQMPTAFTLDDDNFFIGTGYWHGSGAADNGTILQLKR